MSGALQASIIKVFFLCFFLMSSSGSFASTTIQFLGPQGRIYKSKLHRAELTEGHATLILNKAQERRFLGLKTALTDSELVPLLNRLIHAGVSFCSNSFYQGAGIIRSLWVCASLKDGVSWKNISLNQFKGLKSPRRFLEKEVRKEEYLLSHTGRGALQFLWNEYLPTKKETLLSNWHTGIGSLLKNKKTRLGKAVYKKKDWGLFKGTTYHPQFELNLRDHNVVELSHKENPDWDLSIVAASSEEQLVLKRVLDLIMTLDSTLYAFVEDEETKETPISNVFVYAGSAGRHTRAKRVASLQEYINASSVNHSAEPKL